jgi:cytoskeletal protein RodZ
MIYNSMRDRTDIGTVLRSGREALGLSVQDVSHRTRIPAPALKHLENNDYSHFPSAAYTKGFLAQYSEFLEVDATDWLDRFDPGNTFANLDSLGYLRGGTETLAVGPPPARQKTRSKPPAEKSASAPAPVVTQSPDAFQHLVVLTLTALFLAAGVYAFVQISDRIESAAVQVTDPEAGSAPSPALAPAPSVVPSRPAPPKRHKALNSLAPAVAEVVSEGTDDVHPPVLLSDGPPPRAVIIEE